MLVDGVDEFVGIASHIQGLHKELWSHEDSTGHTEDGTFAVREESLGEKGSHMISMGSTAKFTCTFMPPPGRNHPLSLNVMKQSIEDRDNTCLVSPRQPTMRCEPSLRVAENALPQAGHLILHRVVLQRGDDDIAKRTRQKIGFGQGEMM